MSGWSYNQIDVRISQYDNVLGDIDPTVVPSGSPQLWEALSTYGLVRGRPTITPSSIDASQLSIPGRMGKPYSIIAGRTNAVLQFELLVADAWPFEEISQQTAFNTVEKRAEYLKAKLMYAKRVCFKEPGRNWDWFFEIYKVDITESDADEKVSVLQIKMEVYPFKFDFSGNQAIDISSRGSVGLSNLARNYPFNPVYVLRGGNAGYLSIVLKDSDNNTISTNMIQILSWNYSGSASGDERPLTIDTNKILVYTQYRNGYAIDNQMRNVKGYVDKMRIKKIAPLETISFTNQSTNTVKLYSRSGKIV